MSKVLSKDELETLSIVSNGKCALDIQVRMERLSAIKEILIRENYIERKNANCNHHTNHLFLTELGSIALDTANVCACGKPRFLSVEDENYCRLHATLLLAAELSEAELSIVKDHLYE